MNERLKTIDPLINLDWEHEFAKDFVYLLEQRMLMEEEYRQWLTKERNRKPALIKVIDTDKILEHEKLKHYILPF
jgi:hypothetical protein